MNPSPAPLITIGMTCFNAAETFPRALKSAQAQDWPNFEILVVDDGSSDNSRAMLEDAATQDPRIRLVFHDGNRGFPTALNTLFENARGAFIALFDDDDESLPGRLRAQYERLTRYEQNRGAKMVFCFAGRDVFDAPDQPRPSYSLKGIGHQPPEPHGVMVADQILWNSGDPHYTWGMFGSGIMMTRPRNVVSLGGFDPEFRRSAESDLWVRAALQGAHFIAVDEPLLRQHKTQGTHKTLRHILEYALKLRHKHQNYLSGRGIYWASLAMARARFYGASGKPVPAKFFAGAAKILSLHKMIDTKTFKQTPYDSMREIRQRTVMLLDRYLQKHMVVYDIGCGKKPFQQAVEERAQKYIGVDVPDGFYDPAHIDLVGSAYDVPAPDGSADVVLSCQVLEHLYEPDKALHETNRLLKRDGLFIISFPFLYPMHAMPYDYFRYTDYLFEKKVEECGFKVLNKQCIAGFWYCMGEFIELYIQEFDRGFLKKTRLVRILIWLIKWLFYGLHTLETFVIRRLLKKDPDSFRQSWTTNYIYALQKV